MPEGFLLKIGLFLLKFVGENRWVMEKIYHFFHIPRAIITFEYKLDKVNENDFCHLRTLREFHNKLSGWFFRIGVSNSGKSVIKNCDVKLVKIERDLKNGTSIKVKNFSPIDLHWANRDSDESQDIHFDTPCFVDIVHTIENWNRFLIFSKTKHTNSVGVNLLYPAGIYYLHLKIVGDNIIPYSKVVRIDWNGNWEQLKFAIL